MSRESKYLTSKSVFMPIVCSLLTIVAGVAFWMAAPGMSPSWFWIGLPFVVIGLAAAVNNILSCCWYPVLLDRHIVLEHFLFPGLSRVIRYEDVQYMRVAEFLVRRYDRSPVLTVRMKDGKIRSFILMTRLEQIGQLSRENLDISIDDVCDMSIGPGSHMDILLKTPDKHGKNRYTRVVSLASIDMMQ